MAYVLLWEDDWSSYGTDIAAVSNNTGPDYGAYVYWDEVGSNLSGHGTTVGPTSGPNGGPGVVDNATSGGFVGKNIELTCRNYKLECLYNFTSWSPSVGNFNQPIFTLWWGYPYSNAMSEFSGMLLSMNHNVSGALTVSGTGYNSGTLSGVVPTSGNVQFRVEVTLSTITGSPGSFSAAADGQVVVYINDSSVYDTGLITLWHNDADIPSPHADGNWSPYVNIVELGLHGSVGLYRVYGSDECEVQPTIDQSVACCASDSGPGGAVSETAGTPEPNPHVLLPAWVNSCVGGGDVPTAADVTNSEDWST